MWARTLVDKGTVPPDLPDVLVKKYFDELETTYASLKPEQEFVAVEKPPARPTR